MVSMLPRLTGDKSLGNWGVQHVLSLRKFPPRYKWDYYLSLGYAEDEIVIAHMLLTDQRDMTLTMSVEKMKRGLNLHSTPIERDQELIFPEENGISLVFHRNTLKSNYVDYVDIMLAGHLLRREHYGECKALYRIFYSCSH